MKDFIIQILTILVLTLGGAFFLKGKLKFPPFRGKEKSFEEPLPSPPLIKPPDIEKIKEEFKDETPKESADHVTDLLNELFPGD